jgi:hypothetical protein
MSGSSAQIGFHAGCLACGGLEKPIFCGCATGVGAGQYIKIMDKMP